MLGRWAGGVALARTDCVTLIFGPGPLVEVTSHQRALAAALEVVQGAAVGARVLLHQHAPEPRASDIAETILATRDGYASANLADEYTVRP